MKMGRLINMQVKRYINRYIPSREDYEQFKFRMVNGENVQFLARVRVAVDIKTGKTQFELPDFGGNRGGARRHSE